MMAAARIAIAVLALFFLVHQGESVKIIYHPCYKNLDPSATRVLCGTTDCERPCPTCGAPSSCPSPNLHGTIPGDAFDAFTELEFLDLYQNKLTGPIPPSIWPAVILQSTFFGTGALLITAMAWNFIPAYCFAIP